MFSKTAQLGVLAVIAWGCGGDGADADSGGSDASDGSEVDGITDTAEDSAGGAIDAGDGPEPDVRVKCETPVPPAAAEYRAGANPDGTFLAVDGRGLTPAPMNTALEGFPTDVALHPTLPLAYVSSTSKDDRLLLVVSIETGEVLADIDRGEAFFGLAVSPDGERLYASGGVAERFAFDRDWKKYQAWRAAHALPPARLWGE